MITFLSQRIKNFDKYLHLLVGTCIKLVFSLVNPIFANFMVLLVAYLKELYDSKHPDKHTSDGWDAFATAGGIPVGDVIFAVLLHYGLVKVLVGF